MAEETLYIDANEPLEVQRTVRQEIDDRSDISLDVETEGLKTGDFVLGDIVFERKEKSDLHGSITDRRAKQQTSRMSADFEHGYILIEGDPYHQEYSNLHPNSITGSLVSMTAKKDLKIVPVEDTDSLAYAIYKICKLYLDNEDFNPDEYKLKRSGAETEDLTTAMLTQIKGISAEKAGKIKEIGSLKDIYISLNAGNGAEVKEKLQSIDGIGPKLSSRVVDKLMEA